MTNASAAWRSAPKSSRAPRNISIGRWRSCRGIQKACLGKVRALTYLGRHEAALATVDQLLALEHGTWATRATGGHSTKRRSDRNDDAWTDVEAAAKLLDQRRSAEARRHGGVPSPPPRNVAGEVRAIVRSQFADCETRSISASCCRTNASGSGARRCSSTPRHVWRPREQSCRRKSRQSAPRPILPSARSGR